MQDTNAVSTPAARTHVACETLKTLGLPYTETEKGLRVEHTFNGKVYAVSHFVAATEFFSVLRKDKSTRPDTMLRKMQAELLDEDFEKFREVTLYLVGTPAYLRKLDPQLQFMVEADVNYALKRVVTTAQLPRFLTNPFGLIHEPNRANTVAMLETLTDLNRLKLDEKPPAPPTHTFAYRESRCLMDVSVLQRLDQGEARAMVEAVFARIMGPGYQIIWDGVEVCIGRTFEDYGMPLPLASNGERLAFALGFFLAKARRQVSEGMKIAVCDVLSSFDTGRMVSALTVLRDFTLATGASVLIKGEPSLPRDLAQRRFRPVLAEGAIKSFGY